MILGKVAAMHFGEAATRLARATAHSALRSARVDRRRVSGQRGSGCVYVLILQGVCRDYVRIPKGICFGFLRVSLKIVQRLFKGSGQVLVRNL